MFIWRNSKTNKFLKGDTIGVAIPVYIDRLFQETNIFLGSLNIIGATVDGKINENEAAAALAEAGWYATEVGTSTLRLRAWDPQANQMTHSGIIYNYITGEIEVIPGLILLRYSNDFDRNCIEVCEGDIVNGYDPDDHERLLRKGRVVTFTDGVLMVDGVHLHDYRWDLEIIGNKFENPEKVCTK